MDFVIGVDQYQHLTEILNEETEKTILTDLDETQLYKGISTCLS